MARLTCPECGKTDAESSYITIAYPIDLVKERYRKEIACDHCDTSTPLGEWESLKRWEVAMWKFIMELEHSEGPGFSLADVFDDFKALKEKSPSEFEEMVEEYYTKPLREGWK